MGAFSFLRQKLFWKHFGIAVASAFVFLWLVFFSLKLFTRHGRSQLVPDLTGLTVTEAQQVAKRYGLVLQIADSTFVGGRQKGTVVSHVPRSDERVKKGRRVFVTINAFSVPRVPMPNVMGVSYRQAKVNLESTGLKMGKLIYRPDPMRNYVLGQQYNGENIEPGTLIARGEPVDLILGQGVSGQSTIVTEVVGMSVEEAYEVLNNEYINIGAVTYDASVKTYADSLNSRVYKQAPLSGRTVRLGTYVDLWLTVNPEQYVSPE
jgi:beta-lactam-binding protein with PASTA domain